MPMRPIPVLPAARVALPVAVLAATPAAAHPGHLAEAFGHDHWVAGAAVGIAILLGLWGALKGGRDRDAGAEAEAEDAGGEAAEEARARTGARIGASAGASAGVGSEA